MTVRSGHGGTVSFGGLSATASRALRASAAYAGSSELAATARLALAATAAYAGSGQLRRASPQFVLSDIAGWAALAFAAAPWVGSNVFSSPSIALHGAGGLRVSSSSGVAAVLRLSGRSSLCVNTVLRQHAPGRILNNQITGPGAMQNAIA